MDGSATFTIVEDDHEGPEAEGEECEPANPTVRFHRAPLLLLSRPVGEVDDARGEGLGIHQL
jgi:hypothetical protein